MVGIPKELLYVTIYTHDEESFEVWTSLGLDPSHIVRLEGNFWEIGEGPCGPDSEIFYDRGERFDADGTAFTKLKTMKIKIDTLKFGITYLVN